MNRYSFIPNAALALCMLIGLGGCDKSAPNKQETKVVVEQEAVAEAPTSDIFFYTSQHRADKYVPTEEKMGFGSHVQSINPSEFKDNKSLREVWVGPQIKHIAEGAFAGCSSLEKVHFQGEVAVINDEAFRDCSSLKNLRVDVYTIGLDAFRGCTSLAGESFYGAGERGYSFNLAGDTLVNYNTQNYGYQMGEKRTKLMGITMQKIEDGAFEGCTSIEEFSIPNDFKNRMFGLVPSASKWKKVYLLSTEYYAMPKNCTPQKGCTLYVPDAFLAQYQADADWMQFGSIEPLSKSKYFTAEGFWK